MDRNMLSCLKGMADIMSRRWEEELEETEDTQYALVYAQLCQAFAALNAPKPFIQIGPDIINRSDIVRVEILEEKTYTDSDKIMWPKRVKVIFRDIDGGELSSPYSCFKEHPFDSPEAKAILAWFEGQVEVILPYEDPAIVEGIDPFAVSTAESMLAEANEADVSDFPY